MNFGKLDVLPELHVGRNAQIRSSMSRIGWSHGVGTLAAAPLPEMHRARRVASRILMSVQSEQCPRVAKVEADHLVERGAAAAGDLPEPGDAGLGFEHAAAVPAPCTASTS